MWGKGGNGDPYEPAGGLGEETYYHGEYYYYAYTVLFYFHITTNPH